MNQRRIISNAFILGITLFSARTFACSPPVNFVAPTLKQNFEKAALVFHAKVIKNTSETFKHDIEFEVIKAWKGRPSKQVTGKTQSNTCNGFGQVATVGIECVVLLMADQQILAGVTAGEASFCEYGHTPESKERLRGFASRVSTF